MNATAVSGRQKPLLHRLPVISHYRKSIGLQRGMLVTGLVLAVLFLLAALLAPVIAPYGYAQLSDASGTFPAQQAPGGTHLLGTTVGGYDVFSRVIWGSRTAVTVIAVAVAMSIFPGVVLGLASGYFGGWLDRVLVVIADAIYAFPSLLLAIVMSIVISRGQSSFWGGILACASAIAVVFIPQYFRVIRAETIRLKAEPFVESARVVGGSSIRIMGRHIFKNATRTLPLIFTLNAAEAILTLAGLGFLGFGIEPSSAAEWGFDLNKALADTSSGIWWTGLFPGLAIVLTVLGLTLVGESMNDLNDPRLRGRRQAGKVPAGGPASGSPAMPVADAAAEKGNAVTIGAGSVPHDDGAGNRPVLAIEKLRVTFATDGGDVRAVRDVSLEVQRGEVLAIVGESGSGKTVTAKTILGLLPETAVSSGAVLINGSDVISVSAARLRQIRGRDVAMVFQEPSTALNPVFTVGWQIAEGIRADAGTGSSPRIRAKEARSLAIEALRKVGIPDPEIRVDHYPHQFSGGQKQRVVIAAALALNPGLIVADEPTTALDVTVQAEILELLRDLRDTYGTAIVLITHNMGVVADLADRVAVMYQGGVVEEAPAPVLFARPREEYTRKLLAAVPRLGRNSASAGMSGRAHQDAGVLVEAKDLVIEFPGRLGSPAYRAVDGVTFTVSEGEVFGLVGESGSGKTTIGRAIAGLDRARSGSLKVLGYEMLNFKERTFRPLRKEIGFVFQDPAASFNPLLSIGDCVAEPLVIHTNPTPAQARKRVGEMLEAVQLPPSYAGRFPHELSGGQRQRASLARALILNPRLLIADEPTSALDVSVQAAVLELFKEIQREFGFAALFISHDLAVVDMLSPWIGVLHRGRLVEQGLGNQVMGHPQHGYTRRLIASVPVPDPGEQARRRRDLRAALPGASQQNDGPPWP